MRSVREIGRRIKGPLWGTDCVVLEGDGASDALHRWAEKLEESILEAKLVDAYKMQVLEVAVRALGTHINKRVMVASVK